MKKIVSGIQPTNKITLGNYIGAIIPSVFAQDNANIYLFVADLHSLTNIFDHKKISDNIKNVIITYLASGIDLSKTHLFIQSNITCVGTLGHILLCHTTMGELNRMTQYKDKSSKITNANKTEFIPTGLFTYPTLMAADILLYDAKGIIVGKDQKQHVELTRNIANRMNNKYGKMFIIPEPIINETNAKIMDLQNPLIKMSKSNTNDKGTIFLLDDPQVAYDKIMKAKTDLLNKVNYDPKNQPGISNLLVIYCSLANTNISSVCKKFSSYNYKDFKLAVANKLKEFLVSFQKKYNQIQKNFSKYETIIKKQTTQINLEANKKMLEIENKLGLKYHYAK